MDESHGTESGFELGVGETYAGFLRLREWMTMTNHNE
jgi:hypothetical protein